jgi:transposase
MEVFMSKWSYDFSNSVADLLETMLAKAAGKAELRRIQAIYFRARFGDSAQEIAKRTGLTLGTVRNLHSLWRKNGEKSLEIKPKGGRYNEHMTLGEERLWLHNTFGAEAIAGGILEVGKIQRDYEERTGKKVASSTIYDLLHRHGWRKIAPRPHHPQTDQEAQKAFKKTGQKSLRKPDKKPHP